MFKKITIYSLLLFLTLISIIPISESQKNYFDEYGYIAIEDEIILNNYNLSIKTRTILSNSGDYGINMVFINQLKCFDTANSEDEYFKHSSNVSFGVNIVKLEAEKTCFKIEDHTIRIESGESYWYEYGLTIPNATNFIQKENNFWRFTNNFQTTDFNVHRVKIKIPIKNIFYDVELFDVVPKETLLYKDSNYKIVDWEFVNPFNRTSRVVNFVELKFKDTIDWNKIIEQYIIIPLISWFIGIIMGVILTKKLKHFQ